MSAPRAPTFWRSCTSVKMATPARNRNRFLQPSRPRRPLPASERLWISRCTGRRAPESRRPRRCTRFRLSSACEDACGMRPGCLARGPRSRPYPRAKMAARPGGDDIAGQHATMCRGERDRFGAIDRAPVASRIARAASSEMTSPNGRMRVGDMLAGELANEVSQLGQQQLVHAEANGVLRSRQRDDNFSMRGSGTRAAHHC